MALVDTWPVLGLIVLSLLGVVAQPIKIRLSGAALRKQGASKRDVAAWALAEAKRDRRNPVAEIVEAWRSKSGPDAS